jgi:hypothetical protein
MDHVALLLRVMGNHMDKDTKRVLLSLAYDAEKSARAAAKPEIREEWLKVAHIYWDLVAKLPTQLERY